VSRARDRTCDRSRDALGLMRNSFRSRDKSFMYVASHGRKGLEFSLFINWNYYSQASLISLPYVIPCFRASLQHVRRRRFD
jgi:hypothetical protein